MAHSIDVDLGFLWKVSFIAGLGGLLYGYDMGIIAAAMIFVWNTFVLSTRLEEATVSVVLVGAMAGAMLGGMIADRIGRRATLVLGGVIFLVGSIMAPLAPAVWVLMVARAILVVG